MKKEITVKQDHEVISLLNDIAFACVPSWFNATMRNLKMSILCPKEKKDHKPMPLLIWVCGGSFREVDRAVWMPEMMTFARKGYVVASVEYRTAPEAMFPAALCDLKAAIRYLKAHAGDFCIDPDRVAIMGESAGGTMASLVGTTCGEAEFEQGDYLDYDSSVNAVVDYYGLVNLGSVDVSGSVTHEIPPYTLDDWIGIGYSKEMADKASAVCHVTENTPPFLILHGDADNGVLPEQSEMMYAKLQEKGVYAEFYLLKGEGHGAAAFYQEQVNEIVAAFLSKTLKTV